MTREEAIKVAYGIPVTKTQHEALQFLIPDLAESKDEKFRKYILRACKECVEANDKGLELSMDTTEKLLNYLEKQKEEEGYEAIPVESTLEYKLGFKAGKESEKQKEQDKCPEYCVRSHCIGCSIYEKEKEKWPILEVFGFKVGDAVRLKDGDGRKHIIKAFEEVEGVHGPNFYHVEFEDNSARDGIYPGEEYPNGYYTQMEKFEEEQKPVEWNKATINGEPIPTENQSVDIPLAEWSKEDENTINELCNIIVSNSKNGYLGGYYAGDLVQKLKSLRPQQKAEWSEEDGAILNSVIRIITQVDDLAHEPTYAGPKWTHPYTKELSFLKKLRNRRENNNNAQKN